MTSLQKKSKLKTLVISTALCGVIGYAISYGIHPKWKIEAEITRPTLSELGNYYGLFSMYHLMQGENKADDQIPTFVFQHFTEQLVSYDNVKDFWQHSDYYKQNSSAQNNNEKQDSLLADLIEGTQFRPMTAKSGKISLTLDDPTQLESLLTAFVEHTNNATQKQIYDELILQWKNLFTQVKTAAQLNLGNIYYGNTMGNQDWQGKLNMMKSVSPLDEKLTAFHFTKQPQHPAPQARLSWGGMGAGIGFLLGLVSFLFRRNEKNKP
ncbi:hypothetical protein [Rodentibacter myodis]|uniref:Uncharacterized protein n=1 Tax=Rodentibacter myodis TaxID=1907939 RepID=A0A1V3JRH8_9PAST|nr:hypothetical protein [Rodentibacter myodis]OOF59013.1 hypothetical protein BKL49_05605 [Rodentibacter myodis]